MAAVTLTLEATDNQGVTSMRFSNDGVTYTADEPYATTKAWTLASGDGVKTVYVRFTDGAGLLYDPVIDQIVLRGKALREIARGKIRVAFVTPERPPENSARLQPRR